MSDLIKLFNGDFSATNALESFNPINNIKDPKKRKEAKRQYRFKMFQLTHTLRKQAVIKPKFIEVPKVNS